jgi:hypothetical protein
MAFLASVVELTGLSRAEIIRQALDAVKGKAWAAGSKQRAALSVSVNVADKQFLDNVAALSGMSRSKLLRRGIEEVDAAIRRQAEEIGQRRLEAREGRLEPDWQGSIGAQSVRWCRQAADRFEEDVQVLRGANVKFARLLVKSVRDLESELRQSGGRLPAARTMGTSTFAVSLPIVGYVFVYEMMDRTAVVLGVFVEPGAARARVRATRGRRSRKPAEAEAISRPRSTRPAKPDAPKG